MTATPERLVRQWFEEVWNQGRTETIDELLVPHSIVHGLPTPDGVPLRGPEGFKPFFQIFYGALSDIHIEILRIVEKDDIAVAHTRVTARYTTNLLGVPARGQPIDFTGFAMLRVENGKLVEGWNCFDFMTMYQQLGVQIPPPRP
jgi:steroid delta-isomerase-like uncharacterized protein